MKFDQCLFGYEDGHRLLASSIPLGAETSLLTELSDLAPGTVFNRSNGYWTGLPVPSLAATYSCVPGLLLKCLVLGVCGLTRC